jgi:hypothetical protein
MRTGIVFCVCAVVAATAQGQDDEARIEQLMYRPGSAPTAVKKSSGQRAAKADAAAALVGHPVRVETVERGLYLGTLLAADNNSVVLDISLPQQTLPYTLPRSVIAEIQALDAGVP